MNIFWLDTDLQKCAQYHCNKHVVKMPIEYAQMLSVAARERNITSSYQPTHQNHPCTRWACKTGGNYTLLYDLALKVGEEYTYRYGKVHKATSFILNELPRVLDPLEIPVRTPLPNCTDIKGQFPHLNLVDKYRLFYLTAKAHILDFKFREEPPFMGDRFYKQQLELLKDCPGNYKAKPVKDKKPTKSEIASKLECPALEKLTMVDLEKASNFTKFKVVEFPSGRLKKPYIDMCKTHLDQSIDWNKLTVKDLTSVIEKFGSRHD
jgi:hypothetical protein